MRDTLYMLYEEHPAQLVWTPWKDLSTNTETQQRGKTHQHTLFTLTVSPARDQKITVHYKLKPDFKNDSKLLEKSSKLLKSP